jgi:hypothetical protein
VNSDEPQPLDDARWLPVLDAHKAILPRTGNWYLAARDLTAAMARPDGVRSMRRRVYGEGPERELLPRSFWDTYELYPWNSRPGPFPNDTLLICPPGKIGRAIKGYAFFVWQPDLELVWPDMFSSTVEAKSESLPAAQNPTRGAPSTPPKSKPKRKRHAAQVELAGELLTIVFPRNGWRGMTPTAVRHECGRDPRVKAKLHEVEKPLPSRRSFSRFMRRARTRGR